MKWNSTNRVHIIIHLNKLRGIDRWWWWILITNNRWCKCKCRCQCPNIHNTSQFHQAWWRGFNGSMMRWRQSIGWKMQSRRRDWINWSRSWMGTIECGMKNWEDWRQMSRWVRKVNREHSMIWRTWRMNCGDRRYQNKLHSTTWRGIMEW